ALFQISFPYSARSLCAMVPVDGCDRPDFRQSLDFSPDVYRVGDFRASHVADRLLAGGEERVGFLLLGLSFRSPGLYRRTIPPREQQRVVEIRLSADSYRAGRDLAVAETQSVSRFWSCRHFRIPEQRSIQPFPQLRGFPIRTER